MTQRLAERHTHNAKLDVLDVAPIQLANLKRKLHASSNVGLLLNDSTHLELEDNSYQDSLLFFLLHEQPWKERIATLKEAFRVTRPRGQLIIVDYHQPFAWSPLRYCLPPLLNKLEPFAMDLWKYDIHQWLPSGVSSENILKKTYFGGLYQKLQISLPA